MYIDIYIYTSPPQGHVPPRAPQNALGSIAVAFPPGPTERPRPHGGGPHGASSPGKTPKPTAAAVALTVRAPPPRTSPAVRVIFTMMTIIMKRISII